MSWKKACPWTLSEGGNRISERHGRRQGERPLESASRLSQGGARSWTLLDSLEQSWAIVRNEPDQTNQSRCMMRYLHTMLRVRDLDAALDFYCNKLGLKEVRRIVNEQGKFTAAAQGAVDLDAQYRALVGFSACLCVRGSIRCNQGGSEALRSRSFAELAGGLPSCRHPNCRRPNCRLMPSCCSAARRRARRRTGVAAIRRVLGASLTCRGPSRLRRSGHSP